MDMVEIVGHVGSIFVAVSLSLKNIKHLRIYNGIGALVFAVYGYLITSYPVLIMNSYIVLMNIYYLMKMRKPEDFLSMTENLSLNEPYLRDFFICYEEDIKSFFPQFDPAKYQDPKAILVHRNLTPVGLFVYTVENHRVLVHLDYALPEFRDFKNTKYLMDIKTPEFQEQGLSEYFSETYNPSHQRFLSKIGFQEGEKGQFTYKI